jgi:acetaldehyde dehydrogenase / alcohol dehydrogenase
MTGLDNRSPRGLPQAQTLLDRAQWAAHAFAEYSGPAVAQICEAVAEVGYQQAAFYGDWAVRETGMGRAQDKRVKNEVCSRGIFEAYRNDDYVSPRVDRRRNLVEVPRPAGVVLALVPSTNPISTLYFKVLLALMTRNVVVLSPHPLARECSVHAARLLSAAAVEAGAPDGCVQVVEDPSIPMLDALMRDPRINVILATGGIGVVRAAYSSGNPAIGVGPGNVPALVDLSADVAGAAQRIVESKAFDHSVLCTAESAAIVEEPVADEFVARLRESDAHVCTEEEVQRLRRSLFSSGAANSEIIGKSALTVAEQAGLKVAPSTRVLVAPCPRVVPEEPLVREKLFPVLGLVRVADVMRGIDAACAMIRIGGAGHSAAIYSNRPDIVTAYGAAVRVLRVAVNTGTSTGCAGFDTGLATTMTIGTGFFGRSSLAENLAPGHLVNWTKLAYALDAAEPFARVEAAPAPYGSKTDSPDSISFEDSYLSAEVRRLVLGELRELMGAETGG